MYIAGHSSFLLGHRLKSGWRSIIRVNFIVNLRSLITHVLPFNLILAHLFCVIRYFRELDDPSVLERASKEVRDNFGAFSDFQAKSVFAATYENVSHFRSSEDVEIEVLKVRTLPVVSKI